MELLKTVEIDAATFRKVFKQRLWPTVIALMIAVAVQIAAIGAFLTIEFPAPFVFLLTVSVFCIAFACNAIYEVIKILRPSNWLFGISKGVVYLKFRSYLYEHFAKDENSILVLKQSEIGAFRETIVVDIIPQARTKSHTKSIYLDIIIPGGLIQLKNALSSEHRLYGLCRTNKPKLEVSRIDFPVIVLQDIIRINITQISPGIDHLFAELRNMGIKELDISSMVFNFVNINYMPSDNAIRQRIVELLKEGKRLDARNAIQYFYHVSRTQANDMIIELVNEHICCPPQKPI